MGYVVQPAAALCSQVRDLDATCDSDPSPRNRAASVRASLLNLSRERGEDFQVALRNHLFERFLYRLSRSALREQFVLKGAMLPRLWADQTLPGHRGPGPPLARRE